ncbi:hypothetical protein M899_1670 [Bacteriovorax sp. BSW11_IV]|nr:hypothetical protein M899_1670 [Bacteriovorax sp. BSW11_IV]
MLLPSWFTKEKVGAKSPGERAKVKLVNMYKRKLIIMTS